MYADYKKLGSLEKVGDLHGRSRQSMFEIFKRRRLPLNKKTFLPAIVFHGRKYTAMSSGERSHRYYRCTVGRGKGMDRYLHHDIWEAVNGPIPPGHKLAFKDGDHANLDISNLDLLTNSEQVRKYAAKGQNQFTKVASGNLRFLMARHSSGKSSLSVNLKRGGGNREFGWRIAA